MCRTLHILDVQDPVSLSILRIILWHHANSTYNTNVSPTQTSFSLEAYSKIDLKSWMSHSVRCQFNHFPDGRHFPPPLIITMWHGGFQADQVEVLGAFSSHVSSICTLQKKAHLLRVGWKRKYSSVCCSWGRCEGLRVESIWGWCTVLLKPQCHGFSPPLAYSSPPLLLLGWLSCAHSHM